MTGGVGCGWVPGVWGAPLTQCCVGQQVEALASSDVPTSQPGSGGPTPPHHCTPENTYTPDNQARLSQQNSLEKNDRLVSHLTTTAAFIGVESDGHFKTRSEL